MTATEARMLRDLLGEGPLVNPFKGGAVVDVESIRTESDELGDQRFDSEGHTDGHADAFRHAYASARLTHRFGEEWADDFTTAHERAPDIHATPVAMGLHNNEVGRRIAVENPYATPEELSDLIEQAVYDGEMLVIDGNEVPIGETFTLPEREDWPTNGPDREQHRDSWRLHLIEGFLVQTGLTLYEQPSGSPAIDSTIE